MSQDDPSQRTGAVAWLIFPRELVHGDDLSSWPWRATNLRQLLASLGLVSDPEALIDVDLVMASTHAHPFGSRLLLTETDWELVRHCPCLQTTRRA